MACLELAVEKGRGMATFCIGQIGSARHCGHRAKDRRGRLNVNLVAMSDRRCVDTPGKGLRTVVTTQSFELDLSLVGLKGYSYMIGE